MTKVSVVRRRLVVSVLLLAVFLVVGAISPVAAAKQYAEAPMRVMTKGLTAEQLVRQQIMLSRRLARELPVGALDKATHVPLASEEAATLEGASRRESPMKIGFVKAMVPSIAVSGLDLEPRAIGAVRPTADGGFVWAAVVKAENAGAIRLHIEDMSLPANAQLYVYSRTDQAYGPYTGAGPNFTGEFWTTAVFGAEAVLQVRLTGPVSDDDLRAVTFRVTEAGLITRNFANGLRETPNPGLPRQITGNAGNGISNVTADANWPCGNASCIVDATCSNVAIANPAKLAMAKMEWISGAFIFTCTGGLITDNNPTQSNFFLTANHCLSKNSAAQNTSFYWRYATSLCNGTCPVNNGWPFITTGSTVSATGRKGDFTLLRLSSNPPAGSVFLGWTNAPVANTNNAQLYRISNPGFGPQVYSQHNVSTSAGTCTGWPRGERIYSRDITGATDGGSSGSPVLNSSSQVVGQLTGACGFDVNNVCNSTANATVDGAFAFYYPTIQPIINP